MQAVLTSNTLSNMVDLKSELTRLFEKLETADNVAKNSIENEIVNFGDSPNVVISWNALTTNCKAKLVVAIGVSELTFFA